MDGLTLYGLIALSSMMICYSMEGRSATFTFAFAIACLAAAGYGFLAGTWPFGVVESVWAAVAFRRWLGRRRAPIVGNSGR